MVGLTTPGRKLPVRGAFTLVELLAILAIIAMLLALLLPALSGAQRSSQNITCKANLKHTYMLLRDYAQHNNGALFPPDCGCAKPHYERWPMYVFKPAEWNPPTLLCPADSRPEEQHSYVLNEHLGQPDATHSLTPSEIILMAEKQSQIPEYYVNIENSNTVLELHRHGLQLRSNYLYLDGHVATPAPADLPRSLNPQPAPLTHAANP